MREKDSSDSEVEYLPHSVQDDMPSLAYGLHSKGRVYLNHFSDIKLRYKKLALTWLTAVFIGLAYILQGKEFGIDINKLYIIVALTLLGVVGIKLLRFLDIKVYHPQLRSLYIGLTDLEEKHLTLKRPFHKMTRALHGQKFDPVILDSVYYSGLCFVAVCLGAISVYYKFQREHHPIEALIALTSILGLFAVWEIIAVVRTLREEKQAYTDEEKSGGLPHTPPKKSKKTSSKKGKK